LYHLAPPIVWWFCQVKCLVTHATLFLLFYGECIQLNIAISEILKAPDDGQSRDHPTSKGNSTHVSQVNWLT
ncbi:hypothetical protein, partial [Deinococcus saxicola]|uniref:hypothetical protein n=1 Tax=Deinococcus saxicola TaxID=249406 RepID=UPI003D10172D